MLAPPQQLEVFRHELKFFISRHDHIILANKLKSLMGRDKNADETGNYHIRSLYFDDLKVLHVCVQFLLKQYLKYVLRKSHKTGRLF